MNFLYHFFPILAFLCYLSASLLYLRALGKNQLDHISLLRKLLLAGFLFHAAFISIVPIYALGADKTFLGTPFTITLISCGVIGFYLLVSKRLKVESLGAIFAPIGMMLMLFSSVLFHLNRDVRPIKEHSILLWSHVGSVVLAHVFFLFAFAPTGVAGVGTGMARPPGTGGASRSR